MSVCHASSIAVHNGVVMSRSLCSSDSCPSWVSTDWRTGRTSSRTGTWSMDTCQRMLGTDWPGEPSAASGRPRPSTICEYLGILCASWDFSARTYNNLLQQQPLMTGKAPSLRCAVPEKLTLECTLSLLLLLIIGSHCIVAGLLSSHSSHFCRWLFHPSFNQDGFISCRAASTKTEDRTATKGTKQGSQADNAHPGS